MTVEQMTVEQAAALAPFVIFGVGFGGALLLPAMLWLWCSFEQKALAALDRWVQSRRRRADA